MRLFSFHFVSGSPFKIFSFFGRRFQNNVTGHIKKINRLLYDYRMITNMITGNLFSLEYITYHTILNKAIIYIWFFFFLKINYCRQNLQLLHVDHEDFPFLVVISVPQPKLIYHLQDDLHLRNKKVLKY